jgi:hypothetical protein
LENVKENKNNLLLKREGGRKGKGEREREKD